MRILEKHRDASFPPVQALSSQFFSDDSIWRSVSSVRLLQVDGEGWLPLGQFHGNEHGD
jgi:hypothetical protein